MGSTLRFLRQYLRPRPGTVEALETVYRRNGESLPATLYRPVSARRPLPGWVVLHGLTYQGRQHPELERFVRAVATSGAVVLVPEIPEWRALRVAPAVTVPTIQAAVFALAERGEVEAGRTGLFGFSFGATQALVAAAADPRLAGHLRGIAAWGGYADIHNLFCFGITGEHELDGVRYFAPPDPYGRWIMAGNYLTGMRGHEGDEDLAGAVHELALEAGRRWVYAWSPALDACKREARARLTPRQQELFDILAPPSDSTPAPAERARGLAFELADAALRKDPLLDPAPFLPAVAVRTELAHGRDDRLVPFTESLRLRRALPTRIARGCTITSLFAHSGGARHDLGPGGLSSEALRFLRLLHRILDLV
ncbi:MAG: hypothetical protein HY703_04360 [Gemmatimonadetes bacterium]|nr:hypothetical protein [Gemmatimonadota bacterium]